MSKYTTEVRYICESSASLSESAGFNDIDFILDKAIPFVFNFDFPIFDESYRKPLEKKILRTYYTREICEETVGLWKLRLQTKLCNIMPYYNQLYKSALLEFDVFNDYDYTEISKLVNNIISNKVQNFSNLGGNDITIKTLNGKEKTSLSYVGDEVNSVDYKGSEKDKTVTSGGKTTNPGTKIITKSDTPQGGLDGIISDNYLTTAQKEVNLSSDVETYDNLTDNKEKTFADRNDTSTKSFNNRADNGTLEYENRNDTTSVEKHSKSQTNINEKGNKKNKGTKTIKGKRGNLTYAEMLMKYRETFLNIDNMIIEELSDLFFNLW